MSVKTPKMWRARRQIVTALSSTESEYIALSESGKHILWPREINWKIVNKILWLEEYSFNAKKFTLLVLLRKHKRLTDKFWPEENTLIWKSIESKIWYKMVLCSFTVFRLVTILRTCSQKLVNPSIQHLTKKMNMSNKWKDKSNCFQDILL